MNFSKREKPIVDILFILALFCAFLISALFIVLFGAKIYRQTVSDMQTNFSSRTALSYVTEKIRQNDTQDSIEVDFSNDKPIIILKKAVDASVYNTYLYESDGKLMELTSTEEMGFQEGLGQEIMKISSFQVEEINSSLYKISIADSSENMTSFFISLYSKASEEASQ